MATIDSESERERFLEASKDWQNHQYMSFGMKEPRWCTAWIGARKTEKGWRWVDRDAEVPPEYFAGSQFSDTADGKAFGSFMPMGDAKQKENGPDGKGQLFSNQNVDWSVHGYVIERQAIYGSTYTLNEWVTSDHPDRESLGEENFYETPQQAGPEVPIFSEGTGPMVRPMAGDATPKNFWHGGQRGLGMDRLCIDRYGNMANNVARADGSVENVKLMDLWRQPWHRNWVRPSTVKGFDR